MGRGLYVRTGAEDKALGAMLGGWQPAEKYILEASNCDVCLAGKWLEGGKRQSG